MHFADRLAAAIDRCGSPSCVGLDPVLEKLPGALRAGDGASALREFSLGVIDAVAGVVPVVKPQSACYERYGADGVRVLQEVIGHARARGLLVVLDAKRGDIGVTAEHYAAATLGEGDGGADAVTLSGYMGPDTLEPFVRDGKGMFVLVRTSNPGSDVVQSARLADGRTVAEMVAEMVSLLGDKLLGARGLSAVGAVVGATKAADGRAMRARMARQVFLVPGYGAQGGTLDDVRALVRSGAKEPGDLGVLVNASRSVIYAFKGAAWQEEVRAAATAFAQELRSLALRPV